MASSDPVDGINATVSQQSPVEPQALSPRSEFRFDCHPGISCFNACCRQSDIQLTPYDIVRLRRRLGLTSSEFVARYTIPFEMDHHGMPGLKLLTGPDSDTCVFLGDGGCTIYDDRPVACRYYALGKMTVRKSGATATEEIRFIVREAHCKGHEEAVTQTVHDYLQSQGVADYERANRDWTDLVVKKRSAGPTIGQPSARSLQLFDMCSYDIDGFRTFIRESGFRDIFDIADGELQEILASDEALLAFGMRFLRQVLFGEQSIPFKPGAKERRMSERRTDGSGRPQTAKAHACSKEKHTTG